MIVSPHSIAALARGRDRFIPLALLAAGALLALGLCLPVLEVERFFLFSNPFSIAESLFALAGAKEYFLFAVVFCFTVVFPVTKLGWAAMLWARIDVNDPSFDRMLHVLDALGKWSMLDVMLLAIAVASIKLSLVGEAHANPGLYLFCAAILTAMGSSYWLRATGRRLRQA